MDNKKCSADSIWREYQKGINFNSSLELYDKVRRNENFYLGRQWEGLNAPELEQPVLNFLKRVITYFIAMLVSDDVGISVNSFNRTLETDIADNALSKEVERVIERTKAKSRNREAVRDAAVDGDSCFFFRFDPDIETGQDAKGEIVLEMLNNTDIIFGNPYDREIQSQPYIIIVQRLYLDEVRETAKKNGVKDIEMILPDNAFEAQANNNAQCADELCTVLTRLWRDRKSGIVHYMKSTQNVVLKEDTELGYRLYPVAIFSWEKVKSCYHGQPAITDGVIQNQIYVNTMWALFMIQTKKGTFPTVFYDRSKIDRWNNKAGAAIGVQGSPDQTVVMNYRPADFSQQAVDIVQKTIDFTKEFMGASDAALGNVKPDNTSAIIAVQKASAAPLELQRLDFYQFVEDYVRIIIDIICVDYGLRLVPFEDANGEMTYTMLDFSAIDINAQDINIEVGSSAYWSELMQMQTADNLFRSGIIADAGLYLDSIPDGYIKNKTKIIDRLQQVQAQQTQQTQVQMATQEREPLFTAQNAALQA